MSPRVPRCTSAGSLPAGSSPWGGSPPSLGPSDLARALKSLPQLCRCPGRVCGEGKGHQRVLEGRDWMSFPRKPARDSVILGGMLLRTQRSSAVAFSPWLLSCMQRSRTAL